MAASETPIDRFVRTSLEKGQSRDAVAAALKGAGWADDQVVDALQVYAESDFPVPVPRPKESLSARDMFLHVLLFTVLYVVAFVLCHLFFSLIDIWLPDPAVTMTEWARNSRENALRLDIAWLVVFAPVFVWLSYHLAKIRATHGARRRSAVRRWLTYFTLYAAAAMLLGDLVGLVNGLLDGDLTIRFLLKFLVIAVVGGTIFVYYLSEMRRDRAEEG